MNEAIKKVLLRLHSEGGCDAQDERSQAWDNAISLAIQIVEEETGILIGEVLD